MAVDVQVPAVGESITEGTLSRWFKQDGDNIRADEPLFELETEKATTEIAAPGAGRLHITVAEGEKVAVGSVVGRIEEGAGAPPREPEKKKREEPDRKKSQPADKLAPPARAAETLPPAPVTPISRREAPLSPAVRRIVAEEGLDVRQLKGTGPGGRITKEDVLALLDQHRVQPAKPSSPSAERQEPPPSSPEAPPARATRQRMSSIRQRIAERLLAAQQAAAILTTFNEADMSAVMALRSRYKDVFQKKHGVGLGFMSFFARAAIEALRAFPVVNASIEGNDIVYHNYFNIGIAVSTEKGLMVPVLHDADQLSFAAIEKRLVELAQKARDGKISVTDLQGGTFTITNGGVFGSLLSTPILNPPQSAILGMHTIQKRPVAVNDQVVIRPMMYLALSYDHRLIDGREAVQFLVRVKECIESPERLLLEI